MENAPPQLGNIPSYSEMNIPTLKSESGQRDEQSGTNGVPSFENAKQNIMNSEVSVRTSFDCDEVLITGCRSDTDELA